MRAVLTPKPYSFLFLFFALLACDSAPEYKHDFSLNIIGANPLVVKRYINEDRITLDPIQITAGDDVVELQIEKTWSIQSVSTVMKSQGLYELNVFLKQDNFAPRSRNRYQPTLTIIPCSSIPCNDPQTNSAVTLTLDVEVLAEPPVTLGKQFFYVEPLENLPYEGVEIILEDSWSQDYLYSLVGNSYWLTVGSTEGTISSYTKIPVEIPALRNGSYASIIQLALHKKNTTYRNYFYYTFKAKVRPVLDGSAYSSLVINPQTTAEDYQNLSTTIENAYFDIADVDMQWLADTNVDWISLHQASGPFNLLNRIDFDILPDKLSTAMPNEGDMDYVGVITITSIPDNNILPFEILVHVQHKL